MNSTEAFDWLLAEFQNYAHGKVTWLHVRRVLAEARQHATRFRAESAQSTEPAEYDGEITLAWDGKEPDGAAEKVIADIRISLWGLDKPGDLAFHHVALTDRGLNGPLVFVWGEKDSSAFHCQYVEDPIWKSAGGEG